MGKPRLCSEHPPPATWAPSPPSLVQRPPHAKRKQKKNKKNRSPSAFNGSRTPWTKVSNSTGRKSKRKNNASEEGSSSLGLPPPKTTTTTVMVAVGGAMEEEEEVTEEKMYVFYVRPRQAHC